MSHQQPGQTSPEDWEHLKLAARDVTRDFPDAVFIGGVAVATHAIQIGSEFAESRPDGDLCISLTGKAAMRDVYEMWHSPQRHKDSAIIGGKEIDIYVDRQHHLCVPYASIYAHAAEIDGIRVAALEHLLALKCAAAEVRAGTGKGERDVRDLAQITMLLDAPRAALLFPYLDSERRRFLENTLMRPDLEMRPKPAMDLEIPAPTPLRGENRDHALRLDTWSIAEICGEAGIRYRVTGGTPPAVALWDNSFHGFTVTDEGESRCVVSTAKLPPPGPERALRIMEILAYGFQDYFARESMCGRGHFAPPTR